MFICNIKLNGKKIFKIVFIILCIIMLIVCGIGVYNIFIHPNTRNDMINQSGINVLSSQNYTNVLKTVHDNLNEYIGQKIQFTGYVYRLYDFSQDQFVLARDMIISSDFQSVVVGFLCHTTEAKKYADNAWVEIQGVIQKGYYHGDIPIIEIKQIKETQAPNDEHVYPPDDSYIPTSVIL